MKVVTASGAGQKLGVWLKYRRVGSDTVHSLFLSSKEGNRLMRRFNRMRVPNSSGTGFGARMYDYVQVEGAYEQDIEALLHKDRIAITRGEKSADTRKATLYIPDGQTLRSVREPFLHMSFNAGKLDNDVLLFCPVTGLCGKLEMPALPVALSYHHPLSVPANCLAVIRTVREQAKSLGEKAFKRIEKQVYAGLIMSLLKKKKLLREESGDTTAAEHNMVLQGADKKVLFHLADLIERLWDNPNVWNKMPAFNADWTTHAASNFGGVNISQTLQAYTKILHNTLEPLSMSAEDQARYIKGRSEQKAWFASGRIPSHIKVYTPSAREHRSIKENKVEANKLYKELKGSLSVVNNILVSRVIRDLLILPQATKEKAAVALDFAVATKAIPEVRIPAAVELAALIRSSSNEQLLSEIGSFTQEVSPVRVKTIAEIMEDRRIRKEEKDRG